MNEILKRPSLQVCVLLCITHTWFVSYSSQSDTLVIPRAICVEPTDLRKLACNLADDDNTSDVPLAKQVALRIRFVIETMIGHETKGIKGAQFQFFDDEIAQAWVTKKNSIQSFDSSLVIDWDSTCVKYKNEKRKVEKRENPAVLRLLAHNIPVYYLAKTRKGTSLKTNNQYRELMHHKFLLFEENGSKNQPILITGSYNCSENAAEHNWENIVIIDDAAVIDAFREELTKLLGTFCRRYHNTDAANWGGSCPSGSSLRPYLLEDFRGSVEVCFDADVSPQIVKLIKTPGISNFQAAMFVCKSTELLQTFIDREEANNILHGTIIVDSVDDMNYYKGFIKYGCKICVKTGRLILDKSITGLMHHKFALFTFETGETWLLTSSGHPNYTSSHCDKDWNNTVLIKNDTKINNRFKAAFEALLKDSMPRTISTS